MEYKKIKLRDVYTIKKGKKVNPEEKIKEGIIRYIQIGDLRNNNKLQHCIPTDKYIIAKKDDIIIAWDGANAGTSNYGLEGAIGSTLATLSPKKVEFHTPYIAKFIKNKFSYLRSRCTGATIPHLDRKVLENLEIPLPPKPIQIKIANVLDKVQELIDNRKAQIEKYDELLQSVFLDMFGDPVTNPKNWKVIHLNNYISFLTSGSRGWAKYYSNEGDLFIRITNVKNGKINCKDIQYVTVPETKEAKRTKLQENDLLISITADLGRTGIVDKEIALKGAYINQHLCLIRLNKKISPIYLSYFIESSGGKTQIDRKNQVGVKSGLNFEAIKSLKIVSPPIELQNKFASIVEKIEEEKNKMEKSIVKLENNFNSIMQKAFKGKLF